VCVYIYINIYIKDKRVINPMAQNLLTIQLSQINIPVSLSVSNIQEVPGLDLRTPTILMEVLFGFFLSPSRQML